MNVEVVLDGLENNPQCFHGPCLLFRRSGRKSKEYFACSACRDHKECSFYLEISDKRLEKLKNQSKWTSIRAEAVKNILAKNPYKRYLKMLKSIKSHYQCRLVNLKNSDKKKKKCKIPGDSCNSNLNKINETSESSAAYCYTCEELFDSSEHERHNKCNIIQNLTSYQLKHPTEILVPKEDSKTHAQYFFTKDTVRNIVLLLTRLNGKRILCIGAPRIHEYLVNECKGQFQSMLLDIDLKYYNFYNEKQFIWYNMFNNCILNEDCLETLKEFLTSEKVIVLMDPPFGGRVEPLAYTLNALNRLHCQVNGLDNKCTSVEVKLGILWIFPYFMERHIKSSLPNFNMFDLKIDYENHSSFTNVGSRKRKFGSPIRIFTNIPLSRLNLQGLDGYKYCGICDYWVSEENRHCEECNSCTSKNGRTYIHCWKCSRCVKPSYEHCEICAMCTFPDHVCGKDTKQSCYNCKQPGHKKRDCPEQEGLRNQMKKKKNRKLIQKVVNHVDESRGHYNRLFNGALNQTLLDTKRELPVPKFNFN